MLPIRKHNKEETPYKKIEHKRFIEKDGKVLNWKFYLDRGVDFYRFKLIPEVWENKYVWFFLKLLFSPNSKKPFIDATFLESHFEFAVNLLAIEEDKTEIGIYSNQHTQSYVNMLKKDANIREFKVTDDDWRLNEVGINDCESDDFFEQQKRLGYYSLATYSQHKICCKKVNKDMITLYFTGDFMLSYLLDKEFKFKTLIDGHKLPLAERTYNFFDIEIKGIKGFRFDQFIVLNETPYFYETKTLRNQSLIKN